jgi:hypothetical protein
MKGVECEDPQAHKVTISSENRAALKCVTQVSKMSGNELRVLVRKPYSKDMVGGISVAETR